MCSPSSERLGSGMSDTSSEKRKPRAGRRKAGGDVLTCSSFSKFTGKSIPSLSQDSQSIRAKLISPSSRKSPPTICSFPATLRLSSGLPASQPRGQQYQFSYVRNITKNHPVRRTMPPHKTVVSLVPSWSVPSAHETFSSQEITWTSPPRPASLKQLSNQLKSLGRGEGDQSVCGNGAWPQIASQLCHTAVSLSTLPTTTDRSCTRKDSNHATA